MAQSPMQVDGLQVEPGSGQTLTITRRAVDGALLFKDTLLPDGLALSDLAGLRNLAGVYLVGLESAGAPYTTIQEALDAVPADADRNTPALVLVGPGTYTENLVWAKDGVVMVGLGEARVTNAAADATIKIQAGVTTTPLFARILGMTIINTSDGEECIKLTGGAASTVGSDKIEILDTELLAEGVGGYHIRAAAVNNIHVRGGVWGGDAAALALVEQCASFSLSEVEAVLALQMDYDSTGTIPSVLTSAYQAVAVGSVGTVLATLSGGGELTISGCPAVGAVTVNGDRALKVTASRVGALTVNNTVAATLVGTSRGELAGAGTVAESAQWGSAILVGEATKDVTFAAAHPNSSYAVSLELSAEPANGNVPWVSNKSATGFRVNFGSAQTLTVGWVVNRKV